MRDVGIFTWEDEREPGCGMSIPLLDIPCGTVFPKPDFYAGLMVLNLDPVFCDDCAKVEEARMFQKVYPMGAK